MHDTKWHWMNEVYEYFSWSMNGETLLHHSSLGVTFSFKVCTMIPEGSPVSAYCDKPAALLEHFSWKLHGKLFIYRLYAFPGNPPSRQTPPQGSSELTHLYCKCNLWHIGDFCRSSRCEKWEQLCISYLWHWNNAGTPPDLRYAFHRLRERERTGVKEPSRASWAWFGQAVYSLRLRLL